MKCGRYYGDIGPLVIVRTHAVKQIEHRHICLPRAQAVDIGLLEWSKRKWRVGG